MDKIANDVLSIFWFGNCIDKTNESDPTEKRLFQNSKLNKQKRSGDFVNSIY